MGPVNPLAQTIAGTTVTVNESILPLMFVSPQQINAQLPSSLAAGNYTLEIQNAGQPNIIGDFHGGPQCSGAFLPDHQFGELCDGAARRWISGDDRQVRLRLAKRSHCLERAYGPYKHAVLDGFFPSNPPPAVNDSVTLSVGGVNPSSTSTAAPGFIGVDLTQFKVPTGLPSGLRASVCHDQWGAEQHRDVGGAVGLSSYG